MTDCVTDSAAKTQQIRAQARLPAERLLTAWPYSSSTAVSTELMWTRPWIQSPHFCNEAGVKSGALEQFNQIRLIECRNDGTTMAVGISLSELYVICPPVGRVPPVVATRSASGASRAPHRQKVAAVVGAPAGSGVPRVVLGDYLGGFDDRSTGTCGV